MDFDRDKKIKILYPLIKGHAGADIYYERLCAAMNRKKIRTRILSYPQILELAPFLISPFFRKFRHYDITHCNIEYGYAFKKDFKPLVVTAHHLVFDPVYQRYTSPIQKFFYNLLFNYIKKSLEFADCIIAVSKYTKREIERIYGITDVKVIYNGIDTNIFKPVYIENVPYPDKIKLLFVGNLTKRKGADILPKIMNQLDDNFILFYTSGLRTKKRLMSDKMIPLNRVSLSKLIKMYNLSDILLVPSRLEGFGYSVVEAMACKKPIIATNCSSLTELIDDGKGGFLCEIDNIKNFVEKIEILGEDKNMRKNMGEYNRKKAISLFNIIKMGEDYVRLYKKL